MAICSFKLELGLENIGESVLYMHSHLSTPRHHMYRADQLPSLSYIQGKIEVIEQFV